MNYEFLIGPLVGAVIGYITNSIAIKMLFRPLKPIYVFGMKLPFTPGMIPKERDRIAKSIGEVVGKELIDQKTLREHLLSQEVYLKIDRQMTQWFTQQQQNEKCVQEVLSEVMTPKNLEILTESLQEQIAHKAYEKIVNLELGGPLSEMACKEIKGNLGALAMFINDGLIATAQVKLEELINGMIQDQAEALIQDIVMQEGEKVLQMPISHIANNLQEALPKIKYVVLKQYTHMIEHQLIQILESVDIPHIVESKVKSYGLMDLEKLILSIMAKELRAIVWLGALLGGIMGILMSIF